MLNNVKTIIKWINSSLFILLIILLLSGYKVLAAEDQGGWFWQNPSKGGGANDVCFTDKNTGWFVGNGGKVVKTTDGGVNFSYIDLGTDASLLGVCFVNPDVGYIFGAGGKFYKTTNAGNNWVEMPNSIGQYLSNAYFFDENTGWLCGYNGTIVKTTDGGQTWQNFTCGTTNILNSIHFLDQNYGIAGGWKNTIVITTDGGQSWKLVNPPGNNTFTSVYFASQDTIYAGTSYSILRSINGGKDWTVQLDGAGIVAFKFFKDAKEGFAAGSGTQAAGVYRTTNAGETWTPYLLENDKGYQIKRASILDDANIFCAGSFSLYGTVILTTSNSGNTWNNYSSNEYFSFIGAVPTATKILFISPDKGFIVGENQVYHSSDGGTTWALSPVNSNTRLTDIAFYKDKDIGITVGTQIPSMARTTDGGLNWVNIIPGLSGGLYAVSLPEYPFGYAFGDVIYKTTDGGLKWSKLDIPALDYGTGYFINKDTGWTAGSGFVKKTVDGGKTWTDQYTGAGIFYGIYFATSDSGWATGTGGVIGRTTDGGKTWIPVHTDFTGSITELSFINSKQGAACGSKTNTGYVGYTNDGGQTWHKQNIYLSSAASSICFLDSNTAWVTGYGGFVKKTNSGFKITPFAPTYSREKINKFIPDNQYIYDTLIVDVGMMMMPTEYTVSNLTITLDKITHPNISDLEFYLIHKGITDTLIYRAGGSGDNFTGTNLNDSYQLLLSTGSAPFTGNYKPYSPLSVFNNTDPNGEWILKIYDYNAGNTGSLVTWKIQVEMSLPTGIKPDEYNNYSCIMLEQNHPNPFNSSTKIKFNLPHQGFTTMKVYDLLNNEVTTLLNKELPAGETTVEFNSGNIPDGIYLYRITSGNYTETRKMILIR